MEAGTAEAMPAVITAANIMRANTRVESIRKASTKALNITAANIIIQASTITPANITRIITPITTTAAMAGITTPKVG